MKHIIASFCFAFCLAIPVAVFSQVSSEDLSGEDFLPPVQGGEERIEEPAKVQVTADVVQATSAQDAMNAAVEENVKALSGDPEAAADAPEIGAKWLKFGTGVGLLSTGMSTYSQMPNPTATRMAQRDAYVVAYISAKAAMARATASISTEGRSILHTAMQQMNTPESVEQATSTQREEMIKQAADALLKGYVTYAIKEIPDEEDPSLRFVYVSIASTPKTQVLVTRQGAIYRVEKLIDGLNEMVRDIKSGIVPPVGGRVITVPSTDQTAFIGFGSAVVGTSRDRAMLAKLKLDARKISAARARDALFGIIGGDRTIWQTGIESRSAQEFKEIMTYAKKDPLAQDNSAIDETLKSYEKSYQTNRQVQETIQSIRKGVLPPGIQDKTWLNEDGTWAYSMMVYYPPLSNFAAATARKMREAELIAPVDDGSAAGGAGGQPGAISGGEGADDGRTRTIDGRVKPLRGGKIAPDDDL